MNTARTEPALARKMPLAGRSAIETARKAGPAHIPASLAMIGFKLHRLSSTVQLSEAVNVFLRL